MFIFFYYDENIEQKNVHFGTRRSSQRDKT